MEVVSPLRSHLQLRRSFPDYPTTKGATGAPGQTLGESGERALWWTYLLCTSLAVEWKCRARRAKIQMKEKETVCLPVIFLIYVDCAKKNEMMAHPKMLTQIVYVRLYQVLIMT